MKNQSRRSSRKENGGVEPKKRENTQQQKKTFNVRRYTNRIIESSRCVIPEFKKNEMVFRRNDQPKISQRRLKTKKNLNILLRDFNRMYRSTLAIIYNIDV